MKTGLLWYDDSERDLTEKESDEQQKTNNM